MTCRLFIDEVGNDDCDHPAEQYLSLTGVLAKHGGYTKHITPQIEAAKADFFGHNPPHKIVVLHRRELVRREPPFEALRDAARNQEWEKRVLELIDKLPYLAITVMIDKHEHKNQYKVWRFNPYHYCMTALIERYVMWLKRNRERGDVMVEARHKGADKRLKLAFQYIWNNGTGNVSAKEVQSCLTSKELKLAAKHQNICGLQLVELIAHPSNHGTRMEFAEVAMEANFGKQIYDVLVAKKYCRNPKTLKIAGWGQKWLP